MEYNKSVFTSGRSKMRPAARSAKRKPFLISRLFQSKPEYVNVAGSGYTMSLRATLPVHPPAWAILAVPPSVLSMMVGTAAAAASFSLRQKVFSLSHS
jgi:hypothetical protein